MSGPGLRRAAAAEGPTLANRSTALRTAGIHPHPFAVDVPHGLRLALEVPRTDDRGRILVAEIRLEGCRPPDDRLPRLDDVSEGLVIIRLEAKLGPGPGSSDHVVDPVVVVSRCRRPHGAGAADTVMIGRRRRCAPTVDHRPLHPAVRSAASSCGAVAGPPHR